MRQLFISAFNTISWIREHSSRGVLSGLGLVGPAPGRWDRYAHVRLRGGPGHSQAVIQPVLRGKCSINAFNLWKMRPVFKSVLDQPDQNTSFTYTHQGPAHHSREKIVWIDRFCYLIKISVDDLVVAMFSSLRLGKEQQKFARILRKLQLGAKSTKF